MLQSAPCDNNYVSIFPYNTVIIFIVRLPFLSYKNCKIAQISQVRGSLYNLLAKDDRLFWCFTLLWCLTLMLPLKFVKVDIFHRLNKPALLLLKVISSIKTIKFILSLKLHTFYVASMTLMLCLKIGLYDSLEKYKVLLVLGISQLKAPGKKSTGNVCHEKSPSKNVHYPISI